MINGASLWGRLLRVPATTFVVTRSPSRSKLSAWLFQKNEGAETMELIQLRAALPYLSRLTGRHPEATAIETGEHPFA